MLQAFIRFGDGSLSNDVSSDNIERALKDEKAVFWLDFDRCEQELKLLETVFHFHPLAIEDALGHVERAKIDRYLEGDPEHPTGYVYIVAHGPDLETYKEHLQTKELASFCQNAF